MDENTREKAIEKAKALAIHIGYPNELNEDSLLEEFYKDLELESDNWFLNSLRLNVFTDDQSFNKLHKPLNRTDWKTHAESTDVNAYFDPSEHSIGM